MSKYKDIGDVETAADFIEEHWQAFIDLLVEKGHSDADAEEIAEATVESIRSVS